MNEIILDGRLMTDKETAHTVLAQALDFPDYYGRNLDALWDLLTEPSGERMITLIHADALMDNLGEYGEALLDTLREAGEESAKLNVIVE